MTLAHPFDFYTALIALAVEGLAGYPAWIERAIGHPVAWMGRLIDFLDRRLNRESCSEGERRWRGVFGLVLLLAATALVAFAIVWICSRAPFGWFIQVLVAASLIAQRSLHTHVADVAEALETEGLEAGRAAVAKIVGRDPALLDEAGVARAAIESLAENFSDGVVAPAFWLAILGLPGAALYKAINTGDSMIGHLTPRHRAYGWASARLDDWVNLPASRLAALLILAAARVTSGAAALEAWRILRRDARQHRSPNAGWPEAAMAGALGYKVGGPRVYHGERVEAAWIGDGRAEIGPAEIRDALALYRAACGALWLLVGLLSIAAGFV